jgi:hypothetical protein
LDRVETSDYTRNIMNHYTKIRYYPLALCIGFLAAGLTITGKANADVVITYTVNVSGMPSTPRPGFTPPKFPETVKEFYSGDKARIEQIGGPVTIYDLAASQTFHINPATKTYYVQSSNGRGGNRGGGFGGGGGGFGGNDTTVTLTKTSDSKAIDSVTGVRYTVAGSLSFGGRRFGGDAGGGQSPPPGFTPPTSTVSGDVWFSPDVAIPAGATSAEPEVSVLALGQRMFSRPLSTSVLAIGQIPLAGKVTLAITIPSFNGNPPINRTIVETFTAISISRTSLASYIFAPPPSYAKVDPPQRRGFGGFGGGPGGGGFGGGPGGGGFGGGPGGGGFGGGPGGGGFGGGAPPPPDNGGDGGGAPPPPDNGGDQTN